MAANAPGKPHRFPAGRSGYGRKAIGFPRSLDCLRNFFDRFVEARGIGRRKSDRNASAKRVNLRSENGIARNRRVGDALRNQYAARFLRTLEPVRREVDPAMAIFYAAAV